MMKAGPVLAIALLPLVVAPDVFACGDSLYRVGQGISYREYTAPLPGSVLIYARSESAGSLAVALSRSGHNVRVVEDEEALGVELRTSRYDVVIARFSDRGAVGAGAAGTATTFLPVAMNKAESQLAGAQYPKVMVADRDEIKHYLKAIHRVLKRDLS